MGRIITREDTKRLVRSLEKVIPKERAKEIEDYMLYYNGDKGFFWFKEGGQPEWAVSLRVSKRLAYREQRDGSLVRNNLGELDELFYQYTNSSRYAIAHKKIVDFETKGVFNLNRKLKILKVKVIEVGGLKYIEAWYGANGKSPQIKNERLRGLRGDILSIAFYQHIEGAKDLERDIENKSEPEEMVIVLSEEHVSQWGDFIEGVKGFDKLLLSNRK